MRGWWQDLTDLVLPAECGGCGRPRTVLCPECRAALSGAVSSRVRPVPEPAGLPVVHAAAPYEDEVRAALLAHKERGALALAAPLGVALAGAVRAGLGHTRRPVSAARPLAPEGRLGLGKGQLWGVRGGGSEGEGGLPGSEEDPPGTGGWLVEAEEGPLTTEGPLSEGGGGRPGLRGERPGICDGRPSPANRFRAGPRDVGGAGPGPVLLVPVPSSRRAVRARGHDPARRIALAAAGELRRTGTPARVLCVLRQRRAVADQSGLNSRQRLENLAGALEVVTGGARLLAEGGRVVLVDDLMTTGASLTEASRAVRASVEVTEAADEGKERTDLTEVLARMAGRGAVQDTGRDTVCAAVVAAPPDAFEINRN
ncbi:ComF family protein [Streptomyces sp. NPDC048309]|uniref:ComF family protein n=1 Tax=Streptomyces sp. NPDC048309 TaxID=3154618 RepID=UPI0033EF4712